MPRSTQVAGAVITLLVLVGPGTAQDTMIDLPTPSHDGTTSVEAAIHQRRSVRELDGPALSLGELGQLLWAAQGITRPMPEPEGWAFGDWSGGLRAAPSAGALYPLELFVLVDDVEGLEVGLYHYSPQEHGLTRVADTDADPQALASAALGQRSIADAPAIFVFAGVYRRTAAKYGQRADRYVHIEVGAVAENVYLQATALGLGTVFIGAFRDDDVRRVLNLPTDHAPLGIMPVGHPR